MSAPNDNAPARGGGLLDAVRAAAPAPARADGPAPGPLQPSELPPRLGGPTRRFRAFLFCCAAAALLFTGLRMRGGQSGMLFTGDGFGYYAYLPSLVVDRDLDFSNQFTPDRVPSGSTAQRFYFRDSALTGRRVNLFSVGPAIVWSPAFLAAHAVKVGLHHLGVGARLDGYGYGYEIPVYLWSALVTLLGVYCTFRLVAGHFGTALAEPATVAAVLATPFTAFAFVYFHGSHGLGAAALAAYLWACSAATRDPARRWTWALVGAAWAALFLVRWQNVLYGAIGFGAIWWQWRQDVPLREAVWRVALYGAAALLCVVPQLVVWKLLYGSFVTIPQNEAGAQQAGEVTYFDLGNFWRSQVWRVFFHPRHGAFTPTPLVLLALAGLVAARRKLPAIALVGAGVVLLQVFVGGMARDWHGGAQFSYAFRRIADAMPLFALGVAGLLHWAGRRGPGWGRGVAAAATLSLLVGMGSFLIYLLGLR